MSAVDDELRAFMDAEFLDYARTNYTNMHGPARPYVAPEPKNAVGTCHNCGHTGEFDVIEDADAMDE